MKPKLLITLGCSYTEGVGCYDEEEVKKLLLSGIDPRKNYDFYVRSRDRFHKFGWPANLQKMLKYDKLINLGKGGTSNTQHLKKFIEEFSENNLSEQYDVLIIWFMTFPSRISFYRHGRLESVIPSINIDGEPNSFKKMRDAYSSFINDENLDPALEQLFCLKTIRTICKGFNYNFLFSNADYVSNLTLKQLYNTNVNLNDGLQNIYGETSFLQHISDPQYHSLLRCHHPNEKGYKIIADKMFTIIETYYPHLINSVDPINYENEYIDVREWYKDDNMGYICKQP